MQDNRTQSNQNAVFFRDVYATESAGDTRDNACLFLVEEAARVRIYIYTQGRADCSFLSIEHADVICLEWGKRK